MRDCRIAMLYFLLLPLLPACSLIPAQQQTVEGFPPNTLQQIRQQSAELKRLRDLDMPSAAQQQQIKEFHADLRRFERDAIRNAHKLEQQGDWHGAEQLLQGAAHVLPDSQALSAAQQQLSERRELREERVRMELEIHRGEQLLKDVEAYERLRQLKGPGLMTWLELKNFHRKRRASAQALQQYAQRALQWKDYSLAHRALKVAKGLYGRDLQQDSAQRKQLERDQALANRQLRSVKPQQKPQTASASRERDDKVPVTELQQALNQGDLVSARQYLDQLRNRSPQHPQLLPLQTRFRTQLTSRVETAIKRGNDLYSQGNIERALEVWRQAKILAPDNVELLANIARAEKVLQNLRTLSTPSGTGP